ncbi:MAG: hypothetical protein CVU29_03690 [Betaproteobacteria bacterium HGW-Betaproteobacteria-22]|nr:MAG: hypothetical protein CVU29_03690 [Betaproteobacteria bacterium HGW-Betaproteobacteria-22]
MSNTPEIKNIDNVNANNEQLAKQFALSVTPMEIGKSSISEAEISAREKLLTEHPQLKILLDRYQKIESNFSKNGIDYSEHTILLRVMEIIDRKIKSGDFIIEPHSFNDDGINAIANQLSYEM